MGSHSKGLRRESKNWRILYSRRNSAGAAEGSVTMLSPRALASTHTLGLRLSATVRPIIRYPKGLPDYRKTFTPGNPRTVFGIIGLPENGRAGRAIACSAQRLMNQRSAPQDIFAEIGAAGTDKPLR